MRRGADGTEEVESLCEIDPAEERRAGELRFGVDTAVAREPEEAGEREVSAAPAPR